MDHATAVRCVHLSTGWQTIGKRISYAASQCIIRTEMVHHLIDFFLWNPELYFKQCGEPLLATIILFADKCLVIWMITLGCTNRQWVYIWLKLPLFSVEDPSCAIQFRHPSFLTYYSYILKLQVGTPHFSIKTSLLWPLQITTQVSCIKCNSKYYSLNSSVLIGKHFSSPMVEKDFRNISHQRQQLAWMVDLKMYLF